MRKPLVAASLCALVAILSGCLPWTSARPTVKIGLVAPFEGLYRPVGYEVLCAAKLAITERNHAGGVGGYLVELVALNDDQDPRFAVQRAREMVVDPDVLGVIGHFGEETTLAAVGTYHEAGLALVVPAATSRAVTDGVFDQTYRLVADNEAIGATAARYAVLESGAKRVVVVGGAEDLVQSFVSTARALGAEVQVYTGQDVSLLARELSAAQPDVLFFAGEGLDGAELLLALRDSGEDIAFLGGEGLNMPHFVQVAGDAAVGAVYVAVTSPSVDLGFREAHESFCGGAPGPHAALTYDAAGLLLEALERSITLDGQPSRQGVAQALSEMEEYEGLTGPLGFDERGQAQGREVYVYEIVGGGYPGELVICPACAQ